MTSLAAVVYTDELVRLRLHHPLINRCLTVQFSLVNRRLSIEPVLEEVALAIELLVHVCGLQQVSFHVA